jgi:hypothetical protein
MDESTLDRREFTRLTLLGMLSGVAITISGCGGGGGGANPAGPTSSGTPAATPPPAGSKEGSISANHGHHAVITAAELAAGGGLTVTLTTAVGTVAHTHAVALSAAEIVSIRDGARMSRLSTVADLGDAHSHTVTFNPVESDPPAPGY